MGLFDGVERERGGEEEREREREREREMLTSAPRELIESIPNAALVGSLAEDRGSRRVNESVSLKLESVSIKLECVCVIPSHARSITP